MNLIGLVVIEIILGATCRLAYSYTVWSCAYILVPRHDRVSWLLYTSSSWQGILESYNWKVSGVVFSVKRKDVYKMSFNFIEKTT